MREYISAYEAHTHTQLMQRVPGLCQAFHFSFLRNYREENKTKMTFLLITITTRLLLCSSPTNQATHQLSHSTPTKMSDEKNTREKNTKPTSNTEVK